MAVKLHRCPNIWVKLPGHPCWKVQKALDEQGVDYEIVKEEWRGDRANTVEHTGQRKYPWIEFEDGSVPRGVEGHGREDPRRSPEREARHRLAGLNVSVDAARLRPARGYSSVGRAPGSHPGGRRFESG
jgi:hypothetical protein